MIIGNHFQTFEKSSNENKTKPEILLFSEINPSNFENHLKNKTSENENDEKRKSLLMSSEDMLLFAEDHFNKQESRIEKDMTNEQLLALLETRISSIRHRLQNKQNKN